MSHPKGRFNALLLLLLALLCYASFTRGQRMRRTNATAPSYLSVLVRDSSSLSPSFFSDVDDEERRGGGEEEGATETSAGIREVPVEQFRYVCSVLSNANGAEHACTGVLVRPQWVLTAAGCINQDDSDVVGEEYSVSCGMPDLDNINADHRYKILEVHLHPESEEGLSEGSDVALLKLDRETKLDIPNSGRKGEMRAIGVGWSIPGTPETSNKLQVIRRIMIFPSGEESTEMTSGSELECRFEFARGFLVMAVSTEHTSEPEPYASAVLLGVALSIENEDCSRRKKRVIYADVNSFLQWIEDIVSEESEEEEPVMSTEIQPSLPAETVPSGASVVDQPEDEETAQQLQDIIEAILENYRFGTRRVLEAGLDPNSKVSNSTIEKGDVGATLLHLAVWHNSLESARVLVDNGADVNAVDNEGKTPLHYAAEKGHQAIVELLIENGAGIDATDDDGETPLIDATFEGHLAVVRFLIEKGADFNVSDNNGDTALHEACFRGRLEIALALISSGADLDAMDNEGETPLHEAAEYGYAEIVEALVLGGATVDKKDNKGNTPADVICIRAEPPCTPTIYTVIENRLSP